jgi:hypothetical protein
LIKVDVSRMVISGRPVFFYTEILTGKEYLSIVARWIKWATLVAMKLKEHHSELNELNPKNCWVAATCYYNAHQQYFGDDFVDRFGILEPKPSFFNPIFKSKIRYYRIKRSFWCGNHETKILHLDKLKPSLLSDYRFAAESLSFPDYGTTVRWRDQWSFDQLKTILLKVLEILKSMEPFCHMDVRSPNVIVQFEPPNLIKDVHLIDFDYSRRIHDENSMSINNISYAEETFVHRNTDMWSLGIMTLRLISKVGITFGNYQEVLRDSSKWKPEFESHFDDLSGFISPCLESDPNVRLSIENAIQMLENWPES